MRKYIFWVIFFTGKDVGMGEENNSGLMPLEGHLLSALVKEQQWKP